METEVKQSANANRYPGLREHVQKLFDTHPNALYQKSEVVHEIKHSKQFAKVPDGLINYYLTRLKREDFLIQPKHGTWAKNPEHLTDEEKRAKVTEHLANGGGLITAKDDEQKVGLLPTNGIIRPIDMRYIDNLMRSVSLLKQRMRSDVPAAKVFYEEDAELVDQLLSDLFEATLTDAQKEVLRRRQAERDTVSA